MSLEKLKPYILALDKDEQNSYGYRAKAAYEMLGNIDVMIDAYLKDEVYHKGETLLDVFGLLQGFFVGIDGLYDLAIGLTHYKYHININQNKILHQLKYIRNDIVGHPTNRTYQQGSIGFSMLIPNSLTRDTMSYETYIYRKNKLDIRKEVVVFKDMIHAYQTEKEQLVNDIFEFVRQTPINGQLLNDLLDLYDTLNLDLVDKIKIYFMDKYGLNEKSKHRFLWRLSLLKTLILWHDHDEEINGFITYMSKLQVEKLYDIICDMQEVSGKKMYTSIPHILSDFYKFMRKKQDEALVLLDNIHDYDHPMHALDFEKLLGLNPKGGAYKILEFLKAQNDEEKVYLIGSTLKNYRPKNNSKK
ncbi:hypothetical protein KHQ89_04020 [Mycoplasmatota bacterium]|nr:hypothetical protein KHQ89_04020 [Mycoplasmatota bacterium]